MKYKDLDENTKEYFLIQSKLILDMITNQLKFFPEIFFSKANLNQADKERLKLCIKEEFHKYL